MKNQKGVTLVSLIVTIMVMIILAATSIYTGIEVYENMKVQAFVAKMITIQEAVDKLSQKYFATDIIAKMGENYAAATVPEEAKAVLDEVINNSSNLKSWTDDIDSNPNNYKYFNINNIDTILGIKDFDCAIWLNPKSRNVISVVGVEYKNKIYYRQYDLPDGQTLQAPNIMVDFTLRYAVKTYENKGEIILYKQSESDSGNTGLEEAVFAQVKYYKKNEETGGYGDAKILNNVSKISLTETGIYRVEATDINNNTQTQEDIIVRIVNKPLLVDGMVPIRYEVTANSDGTTSVSMYDTTTDDKDWYNYGEDVRNWANARLVDGSIYVWIPRFAYEINSDDQKINIEFLKEVSKVGTDGEAILSTYKVAPAFQNGTNNSFANGEWSSEITGFWVSKYETTESSGRPQSVSVNKQAWRNIAPADMFYVCRNMEAENKALYFGNKIEAASGTLTNGVYATDSNNIDTHLMKNSEWGAVAYLTHSRHGMDGEEMSRATSYYIRDYDTEGNSGITFSSTQNYTGVFGLSGGTNEIVAAGGNIQDCYNSENKSTKYATVYSAAINTDDNEIYGDAMKETFGWYSNASTTAAITAVIGRGGGYSNNSSGIFAFWDSGTYAGKETVTFRPVLIVEY